MTKISNYEKQNLHFTSVVGIDDTWTDTVCNIVVDWTVLLSLSPWYDELLTQVSTKTCYHK